MADEPVKDPIIDEDEQLKAQLDALKRAEQPPPPEEAAAAEPIPEDPAQVAAKAAEAKAIADAKAAEDAAKQSVQPSVEAKPPAEEPRRDGAAWKLLRQKEKELKEAREELARRAQQQEPSKEPDFENQPADYLRQQTEKADAEIRNIRQELERRKTEDNYRNYIDGIKQQEAVFSKDHPDYPQAAQFLIDKDIKQWERAGLSVVHTNQVLQFARSDDPRFTPYKQNLERLVADPGVIAHAEKQGQDPEEVAAYVIARDTWLTQRRDLLAEGARARGKSVAEVAYEEAVDRGWSTKPDDSKADAARARVAQAKEVSAASRSLSDSASAEAGPEVRVIKNRQQVIDLDEESLDNLIKSGRYRELA